MEFDTVIVGAGSAGCVLADRLTADGRQSVLVLEAGPSDRRFWIQVPLGYGKSFYNSEVNWAYTTEPDPGFGGRRDYWPRGKVLGGSSAINAMVYIRGHRADYDDWKAAGNSGWGWDEVLPHFKAIECNEAGGDAWRGTEGPLHVSDVSARVEGYCQSFIAAGEEAGLPFNPDFNGSSQEGVGHYQITTRNSRRMSAARAFLRPAMKRSNLRVETEAHVLRLTFEGKRATGLVYRRHNREVTVRARREVIVAAGAINTPQLLMLSGVGSGAALQAHGIDVVHDNGNVGRHLQDHVGLNYTFGVTHPTLNEKLCTWPAKIAAGMQYLLAGRGPLSLSINHGGGFFRTNAARERPNMQLYYQAMSMMTGKHDGKRPVLNPDPFRAIGLGLSACRPTSRGHLELRSSDPDDAPAIHPNAYGTNHDIEEMLEAVKFLRHLAGQPSLAAVITEELEPGPGVWTDEELVDDIRARSGTVYHPSCTCRMGPDPAEAVVDSRLRVHGMKNLRVVDASVFPNVVSGNTNGPTMMTAHRAADFILEETGRTKP
ncbi:MAG: GMC family oxidoreductase N-terminal domain-containing protein [Rhodospirillales bacterium]|nr:GMC family oxidoreductase N-terminal domain-containing protein [Rhodospirillales bacterium]